jgi:hypothetical protein
LEGVEFIFDLRLGGGKTKGDRGAGDTDSLSPIADIRDKFKPLKGVEDSTAWFFDTINGIARFVNHLSREDA